MMEVGKSQNLQPGSWRLRRASGVVPVLWPQAGDEEEELMFPFEFKGGAR